MIEDIHSKLQHDIQVDWYFYLKVERKEREQTNDALVRLLEDTCNKIDSNFAEWNICVKTLYLYLYI